jgi:hypothetical protein
LKTKPDCLARWENIRSFPICFLKIFPFTRDNHALEAYLRVKRVMSCLAVTPDEHCTQLYDIRQAAVNMHTPYGTSDSSSVVCFRKTLLTKMKRNLLFNRRPA